MAFCGFLKQSTAFTFKAGPFVDATDGVTAETGLDIDQADVRLSKNGGAFAQKNDSTANAAHDENGYYLITCNSTDSNTVGILTVHIAESGALPVRMDFYVLEEAIYDALFNASSNAFTGAAGSTTLTAIADGSITAAKLAADTITAAKVAADVSAEIADAVWDEDATGHQTGGTFGQAIGDPGADTTTIYQSVVTDAAGTNIAADIIAIEAQTDDIGAAGAGLTAVPWNSAWDAEVQSEVDDALVANNLDHLCKTATGGADMTTEVADNTIISRILSNGDTSVFDPSTDGLQPIRDNMGTAQTGDSFARLGAPAGASVSADIAAVKAETATIVADTNELQTDWTNGGRLDLIIDAILVDTGTTLDGKIDTIDTNVDAILVDTSTTLQGELDGIQADTEDIQSRLPAALVSGRIDASVGAMAANTLTASALAADAVTEINTGANPIVIASGTIGATGNSTTALHLDGLTHGDDELNDYLINIFDDSTGEFHATWITDWVLSTELATVPTLPFTPEDSTDTYVILAIRRDVTATASVDENAIADAVLSRNVSNVEATCPEHCLASVVLSTFEFSISGTTMTVFQTDGSTTHLTKTLGVDGDALPIVSNS